MFAVSRLLSVGLRTALPQLQKNVKSLQSLVTPLLSIEPTVLNTSRKASKFLTLTVKRPQGQKNKRDTKEINAVPNDVDLHLTANLTILDRTEIETKLSTEQFHGRDQLDVTYTCPKCDTINQHTVGKYAYENTLIIIRCTGCEDHQVLADHDGTFKPGKCESGAGQFWVEWIMHDKYPQYTPKEFKDVFD
ncbi:uncharacterized protein LOC106658305 [Trichogramma pretiosum]|uniref:uncharacterized protein LOC106658305 n=1 Tax=Trichogramma pretiosum TaxID=7493 RepID=UPI0006C9B11E|nr:uncharacterized protein LOC106658305 [Trichogramma pretiosum]